MRIEELCETGIPVRGLRPLASFAVESPNNTRLGAQLWLERDTGPDRIEKLIGAARASGLGLLRIFMIWPWIEPEPDAWDFRLYDAVFATAARHGMRIKATLGPENSPWHAGTPGFVQAGHITLPAAPERREAAERYLTQCVERYRRHPALDQWILWNEPVNPVQRPGTPNLHRSQQLHERWVDLLRARYLDDLEALNLRWTTGYKAFEDIPFPEDIPHPAHRDGVFFSFEPWLADFELRADALRDELTWVHNTIRSVDPLTPTCLNPPDLFRNHAELGYDLTSLASSADVLGASVHAPWHLGFSPRAAHVGLLASAVRLLRETPGPHGVELTEVQMGNVYHGSPQPFGLTGAQVAASLLAPLLAGAASATGWCLNSRSTDFEAGDWALLDDDDRVGPRAAAVRRTAEVLSELDRVTGGWTAERATALVLVSERSQAVTLVHSWTSRSLPGRGPDEAAQGAGLIAGELLALGHVAAPAPVAALDRPGLPPRLLVASGLGAYSEQTATRLLAMVAQGSTLVLDGLTGQKDLTAAVHRPWPGHLAEPLGLRATGMVTAADGHPVEVFGAPAGRLPLVRTEYVFTDPAWRADHELTLPAEGGRPVAWSRSYGRGRVVLFGGPLGAALVHDPSCRAVARRVLTTAAGAGAVRPLSADTIVLPVRGERVDALGVFAPDAQARRGTAVRVLLEPGAYRDLWTGVELTVGDDGIATLDAVDGIAVLVATGRG